MEHELKTYPEHLETRASLDDMERRYERADRQNDEFAAEHELLRHQASEARIDAQAANNAMYHAIRREQEAQQLLAQLRTLARAVYDSAARELNYSPDVLLVSTAALRELGKAVGDA